MFLKTLEVKNFRSINNLKIEDLGQVNIFTGENNCGKTTLLEAVYQLIGWHINTLPNLNSLRSPFKENTDLSGFFYNLNEDTPIVVSAIFNQNDYQRTVTVNFTKNPAIFNNQDSKHLQASLLETQKGIESSTVKSNVTIRGGVAVYDQENGVPIVSLNVYFPIFKIFEHTALVNNLSEIIKDKGASKIVNLLKQVDARINGINVVSNGIFLDLEGFPKLIPIEISGDGLRKILSVIISIYGVGKGGIVLIDEVENGLHFSTMPKFWRGIINAAHQVGVQLFITTHNEEFLQSLSQTAQEDEYKYIQNDIRYYNLKRYQNNEIVAYKYDFEKFDYLISNGNEIR